MTHMRAAIYLRMSLDSEAGIERQREDCQALRERLGWEGVEYVDNDRSATKINVRRPGWEQMSEDIRSGDIGAIITWHPDRLYRTMRDLIPLIDLILSVEKTHGRVAIETCQAGQIDLTTDAGRMNAKILAAVAENEGERRTARQVRALDQQAAQGKAWGAPVFGYTSGTRPEIVPEEAAIIREAYHAALAGDTMYSIAQRWNEAGWKGRKGKPFTYGTVGRLLANPRMAGLKSWRGEILGPGDWEPIIDVDTYNAVKTILSQPARRTSVNLNLKYLLTGIAVCGKCGKKVGVGVANKTTKVYRCRNTTCSGIIRHMAKVDRFIEAATILKLRQRDWAAENAADTARAAVLHQEAEALRQRRDGLPAALAEGDLTPGQARETTRLINEKLDAIETKLMRLTRTKVFSGIEQHNDMQDYWESLSIDRKRAIIQTLCDSIVIEPVGRIGTAKMPIDHGITVNWHKAKLDA